MNGLSKSSDLTPSALNKLRWGALSSPFLILSLFIAFSFPSHTNSFFRERITRNVLKEQHKNYFTLDAEGYIFSNMSLINTSALKIVSFPMLVILACFLLSSCRQKDMREVVIKVPGLKNQACAKVIQDAFMRQPGIESIRPDFQKHEIAFTYNSMVIAIKNIEFTIAEAGFNANDIRARTNAIAALPPECR
jgi:hypothetical protein